MVSSHDIVRCQPAAPPAWVIAKYKVVSGPHHLLDMQYPTQMRGP